MNNIIRHLYATENFSIIVFDNVSKMQNGQILGYLNWMYKSVRSCHTVGMQI